MNNLILITAYALVFFAGYFTGRVAEMRSHEKFLDELNLKLKKLNSIIEEVSKDEK